MLFMCLCPHLVGRQTLKSPRASRMLQSVCTKPRDIESRLLRTLSNRSRGCQTLINLHLVASSGTHLVLQAYLITDVDEIKPLGIEIWYRTTRRFSILEGIEAIRSVPKMYRTRYPALIVRCIAPLDETGLFLLDQTMNYRLHTRSKNFSIDF